MSKQLESLVFALTLFIMSLIIGLGGFMYIEGLKFVNALYMTVITIGTVGFTEVKELSQTGRIFTSLYILMNLGLFAYIVSVVSAYFFEGKLKNIFKSYKSGMKINKLKNHVIVCGYGRNGNEACKELMHSGKDFIIIEKDPDISAMIPDNMNWIIGDATQDDRLKSIGIDRASDIVITTPSDAANVFITLTARHLNEKINIIVRASELETESKLYRAGANKVILPDVLGGMFMAQLVTKPIVIEFLDLLNGVSGKNYHLEEVGYNDLRPNYRNKTLRELNITSTGVTVLAVKDQVEGLIPGPSADRSIEKDDYLIVLGDDNTLNTFVNQYTTRKYTKAIEDQNA